MNNDVGEYYPVSAYARGWIFVGQHPLRAERIKIGHTPIDVSGALESPRMAMLNFGLLAFGFGRFEVKFSMWHENAATIEAAVKRRFEDRRCPDAGPSTAMFYLSVNEAIEAIQAEAAIFTRRNFARHASSNAS